MRTGAHFVLLCLVAACGDDAGVDAQPDASTPDPDAPATPRVTHGGQLRTFDPSKPIETQPVLAGGEICVVEGDAPQCVTTDAEGRWSLSLPMNNEDLRLTFSAPGHLSYYWVWYTDDVDQLELANILVPDAIAQSFYSACNIPEYPEAASAQHAGISLRSFRFTPPASFQYLRGGTLGAASGVGPCYWASPYVYDPQQLATTEMGLGTTLFGNVPAGGGSVDVTVTLAGTTCYSHRHIIDSGTPNVLRVPLRAGFQTIYDVVCE